MKITASKKSIRADRRADIIRQRDEYEANYNRMKEQNEKEAQAFTEANDAVTRPISQSLEDMFKQFDRLQVDIDVDTYGHWRSKNPIQVRIRVNDRNHFESALSWNFDVQISSEGEVIKETGSWSGLSATTEDNLEELQQTLSALRLLNNMDWATILNKKLPDPGDYYKSPYPNRNDRPNFEQMLMEEDLKDIIGKPAAIKVENWPSSGWRGSYVWIQILKETPSQYTARVFWGGSSPEDIRSRIERGEAMNTYTQRVRKSSIKPVTPTEIVEL